MCTCAVALKNLQKLPSDDVSGKAKAAYINNGIKCTDQWYMGLLSIANNICIIKC